jgi:hypothetical protein
MSSPTTPGPPLPMTALATFLNTEFQNFGRTTVADAAYAMVASDHLIAYTTLTASRIATLVAASAFATGTRLLVVDESGNCSGTKTISLARAGSDTINGGTSVLIKAAYGYIELESDGTSKWTVIGIDGGSWFANLPTSLPGAAGVAWNNGGVMSLS